LESKCHPQSELCPYHIVGCRIEYITSNRHLLHFNIWGTFEVLAPDPAWWVCRYMNSLDNKRVELFDMGAGASEPMAEENVRMASGEILFHFITSGTLWDMFSLHRKTTTT